MDLPDRQYWEQQRAAGERAAKARLPEIFATQQGLLRDLITQLGYEQQTPDQLMHGAAPGYGPEFEAAMIERAIGPYENVPGWWNAREFAEAGGKAAAVAANPTPLTRPVTPADRLRFDEEFRKNRHLMAPLQYTYMQDYGRYVDLLRNLRNEGMPGGNGHPRLGPAQVALHYWDKSADSPRSREDYNDPNYQRFAGLGAAGQAFMSNPSSPLVQYMKMGQIVPDSIRFAQQGGPEGESLQRAANWRNFGLRMMLNPENAVLDGPTPEDPTSFEEWGKRTTSAGVRAQALAPTPLQNAVNAGYRAAHAAVLKPLYGLAGADYEAPVGVPRLFGDLAGIAVDAADPTLGAGLVAGIPGKTMANVGRAAALAPTRPPNVLAALGRGVGQQTVQEFTPEFIMGGAINAALGQAPPGATWVDYATKPVGDAPTNPELESAAHADEELRTQNALGPQGGYRVDVRTGSIPEERWRAAAKYVPKPAYIPGPPVEPGPRANTSYFGDRMGW